MVAGRDAPTSEIHAARHPGRVYRRPKLSFEFLAACLFLCDQHAAGNLERLHARLVHADHLLRAGQLAGEVVNLVGVAAGPDEPILKGGFVAATNPGRLTAVVLQQEAVVYHDAGIVAGVHQHDVVGAAAI